MQKSNLLPDLIDELEKHIRSHLECCIRHKNEALIANDLNYFYRIIQKQIGFDINRMDEGKVVEEIMQHIREEHNQLSQLIPGELFKIE